MNTLPKPDMKAVEAACENLLKALNFDTSNAHLKETPERMARMYVNEIFASEYNDPPKITTFPYEATYNQQSTYPSLIISDMISVKSTCSHHFVPFFGYALVAYIPQDKIVGLSKFARVINYFARKPQVQERLTQEACDYLAKKINPAFLYVGVKCRHQCMICRGVKEHKSSMITYAIHMKQDSRILGVDSMLSMLSEKVANMEL